LSCDPDEQRVREAVLQRLSADPETYLGRYIERFGNVLNADDAATLFDEYNQDRAKYRVAVHPAAVWIRDELFRRALRERAPEGKNHVVFMAGGNAAGKSTAIRYTHIAEDSQAVFDSTFSNPVHARYLIDQALAADKRVTIVYVNRPLEDTLLGMLERSEREVRLVPIEQIVSSHRGSAETTRSLWREFREDTRFIFRFVANSSSGAHEGSVELAAARDYNEMRKVLYGLLEARYRSGRTTEAVYRRVRGR
jgi:hypothetical protein